MTQEKIFQILETKKYPLKNFWEYFSHYLGAITFFVLFCFFMFFFFNEHQDVFILVMSLIMLIGSLFIFFYLGPKQLKLIYINIQFPTNEIAYYKVKEVLTYYKWEIIEQNGTNYLKALRGFGFPFNETHRRAISLFFINGSIHGISLYYPNTRSGLLGFHKRSIKLIEWKLIEFNKRDNSCYS